ncbi:MAG TPA: hypothetical protein VKU41_25080 [Polyangiaceae bacterium]|nr:hypothetical protein [Polyangiaceae bacterium]
MRFIRDFSRHDRPGGAGLSPTPLAVLALGLAVVVPGGFGSAGCSSSPQPVPPNAAQDVPAEAGPGPLVSPGGAFTFPQPQFGPTMTASVTPPPISGGTLLTTHDGRRAVLSDPDRDAVYVVDIAQGSLAHTVRLQDGDEPGRLVEDGAGRIHVVLRRGGALVDLDPSQGTVLSRRDACPAPRGAAWDAATDQVWVACATGELVAFPAAGGAVARSLMLERDLRDVVVTQGQIAVTKFRSAEVLRVATDGTVVRRDALPVPSSGFVAHVAWRAVAGSAGALVAVHQAESTSSLQTHVQGGYGGAGFCGVAMAAGGGGPIGFGGGASFGGSSPGFAGNASPSVPEDPADSGPVFEDVAVPSVPVPPPSLPAPVPLPPPPSPPSLDDAGIQCMDGDAGAGWNGLRQHLGDPLQNSPCGSSVVMSVLTVLGPDGSTLINQPFQGVLPVDVAVSADGQTMAAVTPGSTFTNSLDNVFVFDRCGTLQVSGPVDFNSTTDVPVAVAFDPSNDLLVQTRQPAALFIYKPTAPGVEPAAPTRVVLATTSRADTGQDVFHAQAGGMIACASCHPEGGDDGNVWLLDGSRRRTPSLKGTIAGTAPYHWPGDQPNLVALVDDVYTVRMSGVKLPPDEMTALTRWVQTVPAPAAPRVVAPDAVARGDALFHRADVGCSTCHSGPKFTNNTTVDVGTGGAFQVPPLVGVGWRTPLMHDGCAATLADRFGRCATPEHGSTASLAPSDVSDLIAYLETL